MLSGPLTSFAFTENDAVHALFTGGSITDADSPTNFSGGTFTITSPDAGDQIVLQDGTFAIGASVGVGGLRAAAQRRDDRRHPHAEHRGDLGRPHQRRHAHGSERARACLRLPDHRRSGERGARTIAFQLNDGGHTGTGSGLSNVLNQTVTVTAVNDAPTAVDDVATTQVEDTLAPWTITGASLIANDFTGPSGVNETGQTLTVTSVSNFFGGTAIVNASHDVIFTPTADFNGTASFDYTVTDDGLTNGVSDPKTATAHVTFTVTQVNDAPTANDDALTPAINEDSGARVIPFATLTANDNAGPANEFGQSLVVSAVSNPSGGTVSIIGGDVVFTPNANFNGTASFDYKVSDDGSPNTQSAASAHVTFTVTAVNDSPFVTATTLAAVDEDTTNPAGATVASLFPTNTNFSDPDDALETINGIAITVAGTNGGVWQYSIDGGTNWSAVGSVSESASALALNSTAMLRFLPAANFNGTPPSLTVYGIDHSFVGAFTTNTATPSLINVTTNGGSTPFSDSSTTVDTSINAVNDAPVAQAGNASGNEDLPIAGQAVATDVDNASLTYSIVTSADGGTDPQHGTVTISASGAYVYTPNANYNGTDTFTFKANDGTGAGGDSNTATVTITVNAVNDAPVNTVPFATLAVTENAAFTVTGLDVNDVDAGSGTVSTTLSVSNGTLNITAAGGASVGTPGASVTITGTIAQIQATLTGANGVVYTPTTGYTGPDTLTMLTDDGGNTPAPAQTDTDTVAIQVSAPPVTTGLDGQLWYVTRESPTNGDNVVGHVNSDGSSIVPLQHRCGFRKRHRHRYGRRAVLRC